MLGIERSGRDSVSGLHGTDLRQTGDRVPQKLDPGVFQVTHEPDRVCAPLDIHGPLDLRVDSRSFPVTESTDLGNRESGMRILAERGKKVVSFGPRGGMIRESHELAGHLRCSNNESRLRIWSGCSTPEPSRACRNGNFSNGLRPGVTSLPSRRSSPGWGRWSWALAGGCWCILPTWTTPSRRHSSSSSGRRGPWARRTPSVRGCTAWPFASPRGPGPMPPGAGCGSSSASRSSRSRRSPSSSATRRSAGSSTRRSTGSPPSTRPPSSSAISRAGRMKRPPGSSPGRSAPSRDGSPAPGRSSNRDLTRRGVASSAGALGLALAAGDSCRGRRPRPLARSDLPGRGPALGRQLPGLVLSTSVAGLLKGVLSTMMLQKLKMILLMLTVSFAALTGAGVMARQHAGKPLENGPERSDAARARDRSVQQT